MSTLAQPPKRTNGRGPTMVEKACVECGGTFTIAKSYSRGRAKCDDCTVWKFPSSPSGYFISVAQFAPIFEEVVAERDRQLRLENKTDENDNSGAIYQLAEQVAAQIGSTREAVVRRMYGIRAGEQKVVNTELADAILLQVGRFIEDEPLKTYPSNIRSARELVEIECEEAGIILTAEELDLAARARYQRDEREIGDS